MLKMLQRARLRNPKFSPVFTLMKSSVGIGNNEMSAVHPPGFDLQSAILVGIELRGRFSFPARCESAMKLAKRGERPHESSASTV
jgi:hypothetical protein